MSMNELREMPSFKAFMDEVEDRHERYLQTLKGAKDMPGIFRAQGAIEALEIIRDLPDTMELENAE